MSEDAILFFRYQGGLNVKLSASSWSRNPCLAATIFTYGSVTFSPTTKNNKGHKRKSLKILERIFLVVVLTFSSGRFKKKLSEHLYRVSFKKYFHYKHFKFDLLIRDLQRCETNTILQYSPLKSYIWVCIFWRTYFYLLEIKDLIPKLNPHL